MTMVMMIAAGKFKAECLKLMDHVRDTHERVVITKRGEAVAQLTPIKDEAPRPLFGRLRGSIRFRRS